MHLPHFKYLEPRTLDDALSALSNYEDEIMIKAGGTALIPAMRSGLLGPDSILNISHLSELDQIEFNGNDLIRIGATASLFQIRRSPIIKEKFPALVDTVESISSPSMHHSSTIGGNICQDCRCIYYNQSSTWRALRQKCFKAGGKLCHVVPGAGRCSAAYRGDLAPVLISMNASVVLASARDTREIPLSEFFTGNGIRPNVLGLTEILTEVRIPIPEPGKRFAVKKVRIRSSIDYAIAAGAVAVSTDSNGTCTDCKIVLGALGSGPVESIDAEKILIGTIPDEKICSRAVKLIIEKIRPVGNTESTPEHRRELAEFIILRCLMKAFGIKGGE